MVDTILDTLEAYGIRATFFLQGRWVESNRETAQRIAAAGHLVGSHSFYHARMPLLSEAGFRTDVRAAERGLPGERYVLGGAEISWVDLIERVAEISGVHHPVAVLPPGLSAAARRAEGLRLPTPVSSEGLLLMEQNWRYSSAKAKRVLGYRSRPLERTLRETVDWYMGLIADGRLRGGRPSPFSAAATGMRLAGKVGLLRGARVAERATGRRLVVGD